MTAPDVAALIEEGDTIFIKPTSSACRRTRNRIRERGADGFIVCDIEPAARLFGGDAAVLLKPASLPDSWFGWLPLSEIEVQS
jgi:hypothetical protein